MHPLERLAEWPYEDRRSRIVFITGDVRSEYSIASLEAFRGIVRAKPRLIEADAAV